jgi:hypothetical protein
MGQRDQGGGQVLDDPIHPFVVGNGPSVAQCHVTNLSVDKGHSRWRCAQREPFNHLGEFGWQAVRMPPVTPLAAGQPGEAIAPVLGEPPLRGSQRHIMMASHVGQRHVVFHGRLEHPIAFQCSRPLLG